MHILEWSHRYVCYASWGVAPQKSKKDCELNINEGHSKSHQSVSQSVSRSVGQRRVFNTGLLSDFGVWQIFYAHIIKEPQDCSRQADTRTQQKIHNKYARTHTYTRAQRQQIADTIASREIRKKICVAGQRIKSNAKALNNNKESKLWSCSMATEKLLPKRSTQNSPAVRKSKRGRERERESANGT